jgi:hypothetical protein
MEASLSLESVGLVVAVVALLIGIWHLSEIRAQAKSLRDQAGTIQGQAASLQSQAQLSESHKKELESHRNMLDLILRGLSTHHIGQFPEYIIPIANMIEEAKSEIVLLCDFPAYGSFSAPHDFLRYRQVLERKMDEGKAVRITCLNAQARVQLTREQFSIELRTWDKWKKRSTNHERLAAFLRSNENGANVNTLTVEQFAVLLEEQDARLLRQYLLVADVKEISGHVPLYFWLIDGVKAIFSIPSFSEKASEHGFYTMDPHLITGFQDLEARYRRVVTQEAQREQQLSRPGLESAQ